MCSILCSKLINSNTSSHAKERVSKKEAVLGMLARACDSDPSRSTKRPSSGVGVCFGGGCEDDFERGFDFGFD